MQIVYFSHSYREDDQRINDFFSTLMKTEDLVISLDPPSERVNAAKLQRHLNSSDGMVAIMARREGGPSPYILFEIELCMRSRKPLLVFVEDVLPDHLVPSRVLQRRFSRGAFLRQVRDHRHAIAMFKSYLGQDPPPRYNPIIGQRSCAVAGSEVLSEDVASGLDEMLAKRGYRVIRSLELGTHEAQATDELCQADVALIYLDDPSPTTHYARGLLHAASVPTVEFSERVPDSDQGSTPTDFFPRVLGSASENATELCARVADELTLTEEDFLELREQDKVDTYFSLLLGVGAKHGHYTDIDTKRIVQLVMGDQYTVGQAGAVGPGSTAQNMSFIQTWNQVSGGHDSHELADELARLLHHLRSERSEAEHDVAIGVLTEAQLEAQRGDGPAAIEQLSRLKRFAAAGKWALSAATAIGTGVAAGALKAVLGL
jgi:hypothetical protein